MMQISLKSINRVRKYMSFCIVGLICLSIVLPDLCNNNLLVTENDYLGDYINDLESGSTNFDIPLSSIGNSSISYQSLYDLSAPVFDDSVMHEVNLNFEDPEWYNTLYNAHKYDSEDPYFPVEFIYDNESLGEVGINFKGHSSFNSGVPGSKKSMRIDFNLYNDSLTLFGLEKLNLNNGFMDPSFMREKLFLDIAENYIPTIRCAYAKVFVNGEYYGLFTVIEHIDKVFVQSRFGTTEDGNLYRAESQCTINYFGDSSSDYTDNYELKTNEDTNDFSGLINFLSVFNNIEELSDEEHQLLIKEHLDVESTLYSLALLNIFSSLDSYIGSAHNFYLYDREDTGQFTHLLWDSNMAFGTFTMGLSRDTSVVTLDPLWVTTNDIVLPEDVRNQLNNNYEYVRPLQSILFNIPEYKQQYLRFMAEILRNDFNIEKMSARIDELAELIDEAYQNDLNSLFSYQQFQHSFDFDFSSERLTIYGIKSFIEDRSQYLLTTISQYSNPDDLQINEIMLDNQEILTDEHGDCDPWLELYNLGPSQLETDKYYLSDNQDEPNKWKLPNVSINDGQYLIIWLDGENTEGSFHTDFTLSTDEDNVELYLYYQDSEQGPYVLIDSLICPNIKEDESYGRIDENSLNPYWSIMSDYPSPNNTNREDDPRVIYPDCLFISEIMANNDNFIENPVYQQEYSDWIELHNSGENSVELSGMYLTDNINNPVMWDFPDNTTINSGEYLLIWADETKLESNWIISSDDSYSPESITYHTNFKLSATGEEIYLVAADKTTILSKLSFPSTFSDFSYGIISEFNEPIEYEHMSWPSPGQENLVIRNELTEEEEDSLSFNSIIVSIGLVGLVSMTFLIKNKSRKSTNTMTIKER